MKKFQGKGSVVYRLALIICYLVQVRGETRFQRPVIRNILLDMNLATPFQSNYVTPPSSVEKENYHAYVAYRRASAKGVKQNCSR